MSIVVFAESSDGIFKKAAFEAVSYAAQVAKNISSNCVAVSIGNVDDSKLAELATYGADKIVAIRNEKLNRFVAEAFARVLAETAVAEKASVIVVSNTYSGKSIAPRVAAKLRAGIVSGVISYPDTSNGFTVRKTVFSGKAFADVAIASDVKVLAITPNTFTVTEQPKATVIAPGNAVVEDADFITNPVEVSRVTGKVVLTEAEVVISGGRGLKGPENWHLIEHLADTLNAATACSKPVSDMHWRPHSEHVGQTGITIKPNLYFAVGISGAIQHLAGVSSSKVIVVINKDPEAPFFKAADYGIVGDAFDVMPRIIEAAKKLKSQTA
jgi:electron transfer flavoprotein alpha subunit